MRGELGFSIKMLPSMRKELSKTVKPLFQVLLWFGPGAVDLRGLPVWYH